jgi:hypothetical protein
MAKPITCDICTEETAVLLQTNIANGDMAAVGPNCLTTFALTTAATFLEQVPPEFRAEYADMVAAITAHMPPSAAASDGQADDGVSGNDSAGALTADDLAQLDADTTELRAAMSPPADDAERPPAASTGPRKGKSGGRPRAAAEPK